MSKVGKAAFRDTIKRRRWARVRSQIGGRFEKRKNKKKNRAPQRSRGNKGKELKMRGGRKKGAWARESKNRK